MELEYQYYIQRGILLAQWLNDRAFASHAEDRGWIPGGDRPKTLKQVVTAPMHNTRQQV